MSAAGSLAADVDLHDGIYCRLGTLTTVDSLIEFEAKLWLDGSNNIGWMQVKTQLSSKSACS